MESQQDHLQIERDFINLLLRYKNLVGEWIESRLAVGHFDPSFHKLLHGVVHAFENDVLLTRKSYIDYLEQHRTSRQMILAEELTFNKIFMLQTKLDDYPMLKSKILDSYMHRSAIECLREFNPNKDKKGVSFAISTMAERLQGLVDNANADAKAVFENIINLAPDFYQHLLDIRSGKIEQSEVIGCGINEIDYAMTIGFAPGTLTLFCGDVGGYKSTVMLNVGVNIWKRQKKNVLFVPLEMPKEQMLQKLMARETKIPFDILQTPDKLTDENMEKIQKEMASWSELDHKFYIMEYAERTKVSVIRREIEKHLEIFKPDLVVIDYIANLLPDFQRRDRNDLEIGDMLKDLRQMGRKLGFGIVSGAQLGREALKRIRRQSGDKIIAYSEDVRGSHEYSADADFIFMLLPDPQQANALLHLVVIKSRYGKKMFQDGRVKAALEVRPEISLVKSREDILLNVNSDEILQKTQDETIDFDNDADDDGELVLDDQFG